MKCGRRAEGGRLTDPLPGPPPALSHIVGEGEGRGRGLAESECGELEGAGVLAPDCVERLIVDGGGPDAGVCEGPVRLACRAEGIDAPVTHEDAHAPIAVAKDFDGRGIEVVGAEHVAVAAQERQPRSAAAQVRDDVIRRQ